jgi:c-di-GMP-binding flagellar brake protein YcgR
MKTENMTFLERRKHRRCYIIGTVEYTMASSTTNEIFGGVIADTSESGICLLTDNHLSKGQKITIKNGISPFSRTAIVYWSEKYNHFYYKTGLEFL